MTNQRSKQLQTIEQKTLRILKRLQNDEAFRDEVRADPVGRLQRAGLPGILIGPFLKIAGHPSLNDPGFTARNDAELHAAFMVDNSGDEDILHRILLSGVLSITCPDPGTGLTCALRFPNTDQIVLPPIFTESGPE